MPPASATTTILFLDDCPNEHLLLRWAARLANAPLRIEHFTAPKFLETYLGRQHAFANRQVHSDAHLVLLDYDLGPTTSLDVLKWIRAQRRFNKLPVVMYTSTDRVEVVRACYDAGASFFLQKPSGFDRLQSIVDAIAECFKTHPAQFSSLHALPEHLPYSRGYFQRRF